MGIWYLVYKHTTPSGKVYIGLTKQTANNRWKKGQGYTSSPHFYKAIKKYGWDNIKHEVVHEWLSRDEAVWLERELIRECNSNNPVFGYNETDGGDLGVRFNDSVRQRISENKKNYYRDHPEEKEKIANRVKGFKHSEEAKKKMRLAKIGTKVSHTEEWRKKISESNRKRFDENPILKEQYTNRCRANGLKKSISVVQYSLDGIEIASFVSTKEAQRETGVSSGCISLCCLGKRKTAKGYKWRYAV